MNATTGLFKPILEFLIKIIFNVELKLELPLHWELFLGFWSEEVATKVTECIGLHDYINRILEMLHMDMFSIVIIF